MKASIRRAIRNAIAVHGQRTYVVVGTASPRCAYTIGLTETLAAGLVLAGASFYDTDAAQVILSEAEDRLRIRLDPAAGFKIKRVGYFSLKKTARSVEMKSWSATRPSTKMARRLGLAGVAARRRPIRRTSRWVTRTRPNRTEGISATRTLAARGGDVMVPPKLEVHRALACPVRKEVAVDLTREAMTKASTLSLPTDLERNGKPLFEELLVAIRDDGRFKLLRSPGIVLGLARGDVFTFLGEELPGFRVDEHSGNVAIQVYCESVIADAFEYLDRVLHKFSATLDGRTEHALVFTVALDAGLELVTGEMEKFAVTFPGTEWQYGNLYDAEGEPLSWWRH